MEESTFSSAELGVTVLPEFGGRVHRLRVFGHDVMRTPTDRTEHARDPFFWGGYVMAPWGGRINAEPTAIAGATVDIAPNFSDGTAIHGQVYNRPWLVTGPSALQVNGGGDGWPWTYRVSSEFAVSGSSLRLSQTVTNTSGAAMPAGIGWHPWFRRPVAVRIQASSVFESNSAPAAEPVAVHGAWDVREGMGDGLDATWMNVGSPAVELTWPDIGVRGRMSVQSSRTFIVAASPLEIDAIAVEPQTHAPQGLRRLVNSEPGALALLSPGEALSLVSHLTFEQLEEGTE